MNNMIYDPRDPFQEYKSAVSRMNGGPIKSGLEGIEEFVRLSYEDYERGFAENNLEYFSPHISLAGHKDALINLYGSQAKIIKDFRRLFYERNSQSYCYKCPYCTLNQANTTEHILPKERFPEYAVHLKNLIPACSACNSFKGEDILDSNHKKITINFYTDDIPKVQYLFADFIRKDDVYISVEYRLENVDGVIDDDKYNLIVSHYKRMHLIGKDSRLNMEGISLLPELVNDYMFEKFTSENEYDIYSKKRIAKCELDAKVLGINHWKLVLYKSAAESLVFKEFILSRLH